MPIQRIPLVGDYRSAWLETRLRYCNASEMATICGEAGFGSLAALYAEKKRLRPPQIDSGVLRRGRWGEAAVFQALADERPEWDIIRAAVHVIDTDRRIACTPDGYASAPDREKTGLVQAKVVSRSIFRDKWLDDPSDDPAIGPATPPVMYRIQTVTERMLNTDRCPWAVLVVLINGEFDWHLRLFDIEPDPALEDRIAYNVAEFFERYLDPGIMPPFEPQRDEALVKALYPKDDGTELDLTGDNRALALVDDLIGITGGLKRLHENQTAIKAELTAKLGEHTFGRLADGRRLSWKLQHRRGYTVEPSASRVLRIVKG